MVKIILLTGAHENENPVTEYYARQLKRDLETRGDTVEIIPYPQNETVHGLAREAQRKGQQLSGMDIRGFDWRFRNRIVESGDALVFNLHCREATSRDMRKPSKHFVRKYEDTPLHIAPESEHKVGVVVREDIAVTVDRLTEAAKKGLRPKFKKVFTIEIPAMFKESSAELINLGNRLSSELFFSKHDEIAYRNFYFRKIADLEATKGANLLSPRIIQRLGHLIDSTVKTSLGMRRLPRRAVYRRRKPQRPSRKQGPKIF